MSAGTTQSRFENAPRYTSYPTTPHFGRAIDDQVVRQWLSDIPANETVSLYLHIPFCDRLCWFCACHTQHTVRYQPVARYLDLLRGEIGLVSALTAHVRIGKIHFGGGSPTILTSSDIQDLSRLLHSSFDIEDHATRCLPLVSVARASASRTSIRASRRPLTARKGLMPRAG
jgi:oxygen-independent coproporphyrinogen III oxidase